MKEEYFWSIVIEQDLVQAGLWTVRDENVAIVATSAALKWETDEDLVEKADAALSEAVSALPEDVKEPFKVVFGVPASWVEDGKIKKPHLEKIRLVSQKLSLSPTGFVVMPEAIAHSIKIKEGSPLSGVVMGVGVGTIDITVFRLGNIVGTVNVGRSPSLLEDVVEGLSRFAGSQNVPTRWLLYDGTEIDLEGVKQELISADWKEAGELKFLHTPLVEVVSTKEKAEAVCIAGASEMGEVKGVEGFTDNHDTFVSESNVSETSDLISEDLEFVIDQDIREVPVSRAGVEPEYAISTAQVLEPKTQKKSFFAKLPSISGLMGKLGRMRSRPSEKPSSPTSSLQPMKRKTPKLKYALVLVPVLAVVGFIAFWLYAPRADITIYVSPKNLQERETITLDVAAPSADTNNLIFPAKRVETSVSSEKSRGTTGKKIIGEKAVGEVTIRNGTSSEEEFRAGSIIASKDGLEYIINDEVTVPEAESPTTPGTVTVAATASRFGAEYNLDEGEALTVENYPKSEIDAVVSVAFSGGSSTEVPAISEDDLKTLKTELLDELKSAASGELQALAQDARFVRDAVKFEVEEESFSGKAGDEADSVSLTLDLAASGLVLPEEQVKELSELILSEQVPSGYSLKSEQVKSEFSLIDEVADGVWEFDVSLSANLLPNIDTTEIKKQIAGKQPQAAQALMSKNSGYSGSEVTVWPKLPYFFGNIPRITKNITIEVASE